MTFYDSLGVFKVTFDQTSYFRHFCIFHPGGPGHVLADICRNRENHRKSSKIVKNRKIKVQKVDFSTPSRRLLRSPMLFSDSGAKPGPREPIKKKSRFSRKKNAFFLKSSIFFSKKKLFWKKVKFLILKTQDLVRFSFLAPFFY